MFYILQMMFIMSIMMMYLSITTIPSVDGKLPTTQHGILRELMNPTLHVLEEEIPKNIREEREICRPENPCPCRMHTRVVEWDGARVEVEDYQCDSHIAPFEGWRCAQMKSQQVFCKDYRGRPLESPIFLDVKYGCELRRFESDVQNASRLPLPSSFSQSPDGVE